MTTYHRQGGSRKQTCSLSILETESPRCGAIGLASCEASFRPASCSLLCLVSMHGGDICSLSSHKVTSSFRLNSTLLTSFHLDCVSLHQSIIVIHSGWVNLDKFIHAWNWISVHVPPFFLSLPPPFSFLYPTDLLFAHLFSCFWLVLSIYI